MTFYSSLFLGFCVGIVTVFGFRKLQRNKAQQRMQRAVDNIMLSNMNKDDLAKLLPRAFFPSWVQFQDFDRVRWLNMQLKDLWPHINKATQETITEKVEPLLYDYRPPMISSMNFKKLSMGNVPPEVEGIQVLNTDESQIAMRVQVKWAGNPSIILAIKTVVGAGLQIQVKDVRFWGTFRVVLAPLVDQLPCFGAITTALTEKPTVTYTLKVLSGGVGVDIGTFPGLGAQIDTLIHDSMNDQLVWPSRIVTPVMQGDYRDLEMHEVGKVDVKLVGGVIFEEGVTVIGSVSKAVTTNIGINSSNPYCILYIRRVRGRMIQSFTCNDTRHPLWGQFFQLAAEDKDTQKLVIEVWNDADFSQVKIGQAFLLLTELQDLRLEDVWVDVFNSTDASDDPKPIGKLHLEVTYRPLDAEGVPMEPGVEEGGLAEVVRPSPHRTLAEAAAAQSALQTPQANSGEQYVRGVVTVIVMRGKNLISRDSNGLSDPFVSLHLLKSPEVRKKSKVLFKTLNPEFNESFDFLVEDAKNDMLVVHVYDHDMLGRKDDMGWCALTFTKVIRSHIIEQDFPLESGGEGVLEMRLEWKFVL